MEGQQTYFLVCTFYIPTFCILPSTDSFIVSMVSVLITFTPKNIINYSVKEHSLFSILRIFIFILFDLYELFLKVTTLDFLEGMYLLSLSI